MQDLSNLILAPNATIRSAMRMLDAGSQRIVLVCDEQNKLLGTITDGDTRRALLRDANMNDPVSHVMNKQPFVVKTDTTREHCLQLMKQHDLVAVPIINRQLQVVGLQTLYQAMQPERKNNPVFIMAGGFGTRLQPLTDDCPKPLLKVGGKPILEIIIQHFINHGFHDFYISTHYLPEKIQEYFKDGSNLGVSIRYVHEEVPLGTGGALGLLPKDLPDLPLIMMNGDILTNMNFENLLAYHVQHNADATMCVREYQYQIPYGVVESAEGMIKRMVEKPIQYFNINTGIYVVNPSVIKNVPIQQAIGMPTLLEQEIDKNKRVMMYPLHEYWLDIGQMSDYQRAQSDILNLDI